VGLRTALFFAHECAPHHRVESTMGAQRPAQFAKHLPEFGWRALVVCCDINRRRSVGRGDREAIETEVAQRWAEADPETSLLVPTPSLTSDGAIDAAWTHLQEPKARGARAVARRALTLAKYPLGDHSQSWQPCARWAAEVLAHHGAIDVCVGEHGPDAGLFLARWFHDTHGIPWIADFRDPILRPFKGWRRRFYRPVARRLVGTAQHVVNITPHWAEFDSDLFGRPATCIPNGFDPEEYPAAEPDAGFTVSYVGNLVPEQPIELALAAWAAFIATPFHRRTQACPSGLPGPRARSRAQRCSQCRSRDHARCRWADESQRNASPHEALTASPALLGRRPGSEVFPSPRAVSGKGLRILRSTPPHSLHARRRWPTRPTPQRDPHGRHLLVSRGSLGLLRRGLYRMATGRKARLPAR